MFPFLCWFGSGFASRLLWASPFATQPFAERRKKGRAKKFSTTIFLRFVPSDSVLPQGLERKAARVPGQVVQLTDLEAMSSLTHLVLPTYPKEATDMRLQGMAVVSVTVGKNGEVVDAKPASAHPLIARAAVDAVRQWRFEPCKLDGEAVDVSAKVSVLFIQGEP